ncbi:hypothetical protein HJC23_012699 [Cyclotella cryptica]|uniref:Uncharacterized protein n=1 Tax=Cyclotella cryptica TaxID=29204 RepID=A0ABD3PLR1_9STRA|eukprot:CCRYP_013331-RA/>CCRYP_013331-RA protein AED:0.16 eAED:0.16 QI:95/1/1/1/1/1/3/1187/195
MALFGLTALGPHPFTSLQDNHTTLHFFTEHDVRLAWNKVGSESEETLPIESLKTLLNELYRGTAPECEVKRLHEYVQHSVNIGRISWTALRKAFVAIREQALFNEINNNLTHSERQLFTSNHDYREAVRRHNARRNYETNDKDTSRLKPLTTNECYGCMRGNEAYSSGIPHKIRGKKSCPETLYCNELIMSGFTY